MSWIQKLYETYDNCAGQPQFASEPLPPISARPQDTQICITLNGRGGFRNAELVLLKATPILVSEASAARSGRNPAANPLADKLSYCAGDGSAYGLNPDYFARFEVQLSEWCSSEYRDSKACVVLEYIKQRGLIKDLIEHGILTWNDEKFDPIKLNGKTLDPSEAWIRWRVERQSEIQANTWDDPETFLLWERFESSRSDAVSLCMSSGATARIARLHPKSIRSSRDQAKLISSNGTEGYTFKGRFLDAEQCASLGYIASQKAHSALRWLIGRQGVPNGDQVIVAWAVHGQSVPKLIAASDEIETADGSPEVLTIPDNYEGDVGQLFAKQLNSLIQGYAAKLSDREDIVIMALDSATPGRMAITYYRELSGSEFLARIEDWHKHTAWPLNMGVGRHFIGAPAPADIAEVTYGRLRKGKLQIEKLRKSTIERLLPCIVDQRPIPRDLVESCARRAMNRTAYGEGQEYWEWERTLGVACALVRGSRREERYSMSLEEDRSTRDYLFGRVLAVAEKIESYALYLQREEKGRVTSAERLMQRFVDHPASTWRNIELALVPYMAHLQGGRGRGLVYGWRKLLDEITTKFQGDDFTRPGRLDAEFLLGYHCQRAALNQKRTGTSDIESPDASDDITAPIPGDLQ